MIPVVPPKVAQAASDRDLLRHFAASRSDAAFSELVDRHLNFVYATALRRLAGDAHLARDVAQHVFTDLARHADRVSRHPVVSGWLYSAACFAAAKVVRTEHRRRARESKAAAMHEALHESAHDAEWAQVRPVIDDALGALKEGDRHAILLRFFHAQTFAQIGEQLELNENAARMRVDRALDQLRSQLTQHGIVSTAAALASTLAANASVSLPAGTAASITSTALASAASAGAAGWWLFSATGTKLQVAAAAVVLAAGTVGIVKEEQLQRQLLAQNGFISQEHARTTALAEDAQRMEGRLAAVQATVPTPEEFRKVGDEIAALLGATAQQRVQQSPVSSSGRNVASYRPSDLGELDKVPVVLFQDRPKYPLDLRHAKVNGEAMVEFVVTKDGGVRELEVKRSTHRSLEQPIRDAVRNWRFEPGQKDGRAVETRMQVPFVFSLNEDDPNWF